MRSMLAVLLVVVIAMAQGYVQQGDDTYFHNLSVRGILSVPFYVAQFVTAEVSGDLDVDGTATIGTAFIDTLQVDGYIATDYITSDVGLIDTLWASYMASSPIIAGTSVTCQDFNCDSSFYMNPVAWATFFAGMPDQRETFRFLTTQLVPIDHVVSFVGLGHVPVILFSTVDDTSSVFLQFDTESGYIGSDPEIMFDWIASDTLYAGDYFTFRTYHLQASPGMAVATIDTFDFALTVLADTLIPAYYQSAWFTLEEASYLNHNLHIMRDTTDTAAADIGILGWTVRIDPTPAPL